MVKGPPIDLPLVFESELITHHGNGAKWFTPPVMFLREPRVEGQTTRSGRAHENVYDCCSFLALPDRLWDATEG
jgi:hypothetical protein